MSNDKMGNVKQGGQQQGGQQGGQQKNGFQQGELVRIGDPIYEVGENKSAKEQRLARKAHMPSWAVSPYRACQSHELDVRN